MLKDTLLASSEGTDAGGGGQCPKKSNGADSHQYDSDDVQVDAGHLRGDGEGEYGADSDDEDAHSDAHNEMLPREALGLPRFAQPSLNSNMEGRRGHQDERPSLPAISGGKPPDGHNNTSCPPVVVRSALPPLQAHRSSGIALRHGIEIGTPRFRTSGG